jgi:hypothetical protein
MDHDSPSQQTGVGQQASDALQARLAALDGATLSRLRQARAQAMAHGLKRRHRWLSFGLPAAGALAAATLLAVHVWYGQPQDIPGPDLALLESLAPDKPAPAPAELDFYEWLAAGNNGAA